MNAPNITRALFRGNRGLTVGLLIMFSLIIISACIALVLPQTIRKSIDAFISDYTLADAWLITEPSTEKPQAALEAIDGIACAEPGLAIDIQMRLSDGREYAVRIFGVEENTFQHFHTFSLTDPAGEIGVWVSAKFADIHGLRCDDTLSLQTPDGEYVDVCLEKIVSNPECMQCTRDDFSWNDVSDFCYLYIRRADMDKLSDIEGVYNHWAIRFTPEADSAQRKGAINKAKEILGEGVMSSLIYEESQAKSAIDSELRSLNATVLYMLGILSLVGICFTALFVCQVVEKERRKIGLLRALGYSRSQVFTVFLRYVGTISLLAICTGMTVGAVIVRFSIEVYRKMYSIPHIHYAVRYGLLAIFLLVYFLIGLLACLFSADKIIRIDPSEAYGGPPISNTMPPAFLQKLHLSAFSKISISSQWRNKKRMIQATLSISVCMMLTFMSISILTAMKAAFPAVFGDRLRYDSHIRFTAGSDSAKEIAAVNGVSHAEALILLRESIRMDNQENSAQINAIPADSQLIILRNPDGEKLIPTDNGILLDEWFAKRLGASVGDTVIVGDIPLTVTGIVREFVRSIQYVTPATAEKLGYDTVNAAVITVDPQADPETVYGAVGETEGFLYQTLTTDQKISVEIGFHPLNVVTYAYAAIAMLLGLIIIYNMVVITTSERRHEYATLLALGAGHRQFAVIALIENGIRYVEAVFLAFPFGFSASALLRSAMSTVSHSFPAVFLWRCFGIACGISLLYILMGMAIAVYLIRRIDPAITLNERE